MNNTTTARVYVGTYAKYNSGSIGGAWLDLEGYSDKEEFLAACAELHKDEADPELMFQDFEGFPRAFYGESGIDAGVWEWLALDEYDKELLAVYQAEVDSDATIETVRDAFMGKADSEEDWAAEYLRDTGILSDVPESLRNYIDYAAYARDARMGGDVSFARHEGEVWVFSNH